MISPPSPENESDRQLALHSYAILDTLPEKEYDEITALASMICDTPMSLVSLIDENRQWFKSNYGLDTRETPREYAFCAHAITKKDEMLIVNDARTDERFKDNPLVQGNPNLVFYAGMPLVNPEGLPLGTLCVLDIKPKQLTEAQQTALKYLSNQLMTLLELRKNNILLHQNNRKVIARNKILKNFVSIAAHDIKSPMNNVLSLSEMLLTDYGNTLDADGLELVEHIHTSVQHSTNLIDGILKYSKDINGVLEDTQSIHLQSFLNGLKKLMVTGDHIQMEIEVDPNLQALMNKTALHQILSNLVTNSIKYTHEDIVTINIQVTDEHTQLKFSVKDNGPGIPSKDKKRIFKPFATTTNKDRNGFYGTGIGLATVKNLVQSLGGKISLVSNKDQGANFVFTLPKI